MNNIIVALIITLLIIIVFGFLIGLAFYEGDKFFDAATFYHGYEVAQWFENNNEEVDMSKYLDLNGVIMSSIWNIKMKKNFKNILSNER